MITASFDRNGIGPAVLELVLVYVDPGRDPAATSQSNRGTHRRSSYWAIDAKAPYNEVLG